MAGPPPPSCFAPTSEQTRSPQRFIASALEIKSWCARTPSCAEARPGSCPCCGTAAQPVGKPLVIVGHGLVERQVLGPATASAPAEHRLLRLRRYRCRACHAILVIGPRGLIVRRWYGAGAIALAFAVVARGGTSAEARARTSPAPIVGVAAAERWTTLARWIDAARCGLLFDVTGLGGLARRRVAEQVVLALAARGGRALGAALAESAFAGASLAA